MGLRRVGRCVRAAQGQDALQSPRELADSTANSQDPARTTRLVEAIFAAPDVARNPGSRRARVPSEEPVSAARFGSRRLVGGQQASGISRSFSADAKVQCDVENPLESPPQESSRSSRRFGPSASTCVACRFDERR